MKTTPQNKNVSIVKEQGSVSDSLARKSSLKARKVTTDKNIRESKIETGRQMSDADLASAVAVATAAAGTNRFCYLLLKSIIWIKTC